MYDNSHSKIAHNVRVTDGFLAVSDTCIQYASRITNRFLGFDLLSNKEQIDWLMVVSRIGSRHEQRPTLRNVEAVTRVLCAVMRMLTVLQFYTNQIAGRYFQVFQIHFIPT